MRIGCDIGGVVKNLTSDEPIWDAIETLTRLKEEGHEIVFISKCGASYATHTVEWLALHGLSSFEIVFCDGYAGKVELARTYNIKMMIDDKMTVLKHFPPDSFQRVWFCTEQKNIAGAKKHDPDFFQSVHLVQSWSEIEELISTTAK
jgi:uncharacterized HAD superfamily protein